MDIEWAFDLPCVQRAGVEVVWTDGSLVWAVRGGKSASAEIRGEGLEREFQVVRAVKDAVWRLGAVDGDGHGGGRSVSALAGPG